MAGPRSRRTLVGTACYLGGAGWPGMAATALALAAAFLNAAFGYCLGCEVYLMLRRGQARFTPDGL